MTDVWVLRKIVELAPDSFELSWRRGVGIWKTTRATAAQLDEIRARQVLLGLPAVRISDRPLEAS